MRHFNTIRISAFVLTLVTLFAACRDDDIVEGMEDGTGEYLELRLNLQVAAEQDGISPDCPTPQKASGIDSKSKSLSCTRSFVDPDVSSDASVRNVWVIQYRGTDDKAAVIGKPQYIPDFDAAVSTVRLLQTPQPCFVVILANTFNENLSFNPGSTIGLLKDKMKESIRREADVLGYDRSTVSADASFPCDADYYPIMFGVQRIDGGIDASTPVSATLRRNVAKIVFNVTNSTAGKTHPLTITGVSLNSIPDRSRYVTDYGILGGEQPALYPSASDNVTFDTELHLWNDASGTGTQRTFTFYMPVNRRGTTTCSDEKRKSVGAPLGATYALISAYYMDGGRQIPVSFRLYVGANLKNDFNIEANHVYSYDVNINDISGSDTDLRMSVWSDVDFSGTATPRANCYILNPPTVPGYVRHFRIPVDRVNTFWGDDTGNDHPYENNPQYYLLSQTPWTVDIIWSDFILHTDPADDNYNFRLTKSIGSGPSDYIEVAVPDGASGNVLIGLRTKPTGMTEYNTGYSWSWHLWITDYDPSPARQMSGAEGVFVYPVINGNVHRYKGTLWEGAGKYSGNTFIMDRNLGRLSEFSTGTGQGALYYQFGNKNPFPGTAWYDVSGTSKNVVYVSQSYTQAHADAMANGTASPEEMTKHNNVPTTIWNPTSFVIMWTANASHSWPYYWTFEDKYNPRVFDASVLWLDPTTRTGGPREGRKSLFDPCPPGWTMPLGQTFSDFTNNTTKKGNVYVGTTNVGGGTTPNRGFRSFDTAGGCIYWPYVQSSSGDYNAEGEIFVPKSQFRNAYYNKGKLYSTTNVYLLTSQLNKYPWGAGALTGYAYDPYYNFFYTRGNWHQVDAFPVRCISSLTSED